MAAGLFKRGRWKKVELVDDPREYIGDYILFRKTIIST